MNNEQLNRDYNITDSELTTFTQNLCDSITRDITEFTLYGVTATNVTALQTLCDAFEIFPTDEYIFQEFSSSVEAKDNILNEVKVIMREMALRTELKWGKSSPKYKSLGISDMSQISAEAFITRARMLLAFMTENLTALSAEGLTQAMLDELSDKIDALDEAIREQMRLASYRMEKTTERITKGNNIYSLVSKYCEIGKRIWDGINPAKYHDYIIYTSISPGTLTAPTNFVFDPVALRFTWDAVVNATSYELESSTDGVNFSQYWADSVTVCVLSELPTTLMYYRVRARNANGYGPFSDVIEYDFTIPLIAPGNFVYTANISTFSWEAVPTATSYEVQYKNVVQVVWASINAGSATSVFHASPAGNYVAKIRAKRGTENGPFGPEINYTVS